MNASFKNYCEKRSFKEDYTDTLAANVYHNDDDALNQLRDTRPLAHKKYSLKLEKLRLAKKSAESKIRELESNLATFKKQLEKIDADYEETRFQMGQGAANTDHGVPSRLSGKMPFKSQMGFGTSDKMSTMSPHAMDRMSHDTPLPSDHAGTHGDVTSLDQNRWSLAGRRPVRASETGEGPPVFKNGKWMPTWTPPND